MNNNNRSSFNKPPPPVPRRNDSMFVNQLKAVKMKLIIIKHIIDVTPVMNAYLSKNEEGGIDPISGKMIRGEEVYARTDDGLVFANLQNQQVLIFFFL